MSEVVESAKAAKTADLRVRLKSYAVEIVRLFNVLPRGREDVRVVSKQLLRSATSVAANHREACRARSRAEFVSKIEICIQEGDESIFWLELLRDGCDLRDLDELLMETNEIISILVATARTAKRNDAFSS